MRKINDTELLTLKDQGMPQKEIAQHFGVSDAAVSKRLKRLKPLPESLNKLADKEQQFAIEVAGGKTQTLSALSAYECSSMAAAKTIGSQLMAKPDIQVAVGDLMQEEGLSRRYRVRKLKQHIDALDPNASLKGLDQSWKLEGLYAEKIVHAHVSYADLTREEEDIKRELKELNRQLGELPEDEEEDDVVDAESEEMEK
jgi:predicted transcriptional regulator